LRETNKCTNQPKREIEREREEEREREGKMNPLKVDLVRQGVRACRF
jgi:hypothetical protein